ncbi:MAG: alpha-amylase family protein [Paludibacteraceae bacterium]|nr:alpha-amylase family protein [Paludibacteraceae bacterium]
MLNKPIIYQVIPRLFSNYNETRKHNGSKEENGCGKMADINEKALKSIADLGVTHVWYTGIIRHATAEHNNPAITKGKAGSPYAITDYYDVNPDLAKNEKKRMAEWEALIERTHAAGLGVLMDFVPNHVAREYKSECKPAGVQDLGEGDHPEWAFSPLNNFYYLPGERFTMDKDLQGYDEMPAKVTGNDCWTSHPSENDWYETVKLNYGVFYQGGREKQFDPIPSTWQKMLDILLYWAGKKIDGVRVDMAEMVPVEFFAWAIAKLRKKYPKFLVIGECYDPGQYDAYLQAGFNYLYDKVGMYDYLRGVTSKNWPAEGITHQWMQHGDERLKHMLYFLENHDEQRIASGFFCGDGACAEPAMIVAATLNQSAVMVYMGQELGERGMDMEGFSGIDGRTTIFDYWGVKSIQAWANKGKYDGGKLSPEQKELRGFYRQLLSLARQNRAIQKGAMYDITYAQGEGFNKHEQFAYIRHIGTETLLIVVNFHDRAQQMHVRIPNDAFVYLEMEERQRATATDLLRGGKQEISFVANEPIEVTLPAWRGVILKIK